MTEVAYQPIIPRTLLDLWGSSEGASPALWDRIAPLLGRGWDEAMARCLGPDRARTAQLIVDADPTGEGLARPVVERCVAVAIESKMVSLTQTLAAAGDVAAGDPSLSMELDGGASLECVRSGHASSVVRLGGSWALNVARDLDRAAAELDATAAALRSWRGGPEVRVPEILGSATGRCRWFDREIEVPVLAVEWLAGAEELHVVSTGKGPGFVRVAGFRHLRGRAPLIVGELLGGEEWTRIWRSVSLARTATAKIDEGTDLISAPELEPNDGDIVVWPDGVVGLVGASSARWTGPLAAWPYFIALSSARDDDGPCEARLRWAEPEEAVEAVADGCRAREAPGLGASMLSAAAELSPKRAAMLAVGSEDPEAVELCHAVQRTCLRVAHHPGMRREAGGSDDRYLESLATP